MKKLMTKENKIKVIAEVDGITQCDPLKCASNDLFHKAGVGSIHYFPRRNSASDCEVV